MTLLANTSVPQTRESPQQDTAIAGTRVSLAPPAGFTPSPQFPGYWQESLGSSIVVMEFPGSFLEISSGFSNPSALAKRGMALLNKQDIKLDGRSGLLLQVRQNAYGTEFLKWVLIFGDDKESVMIGATFPKELEGELSEKMKASVLTAKWDQDRKVSRTEGLDFSVSEKGDLRLAQRLVNSLLYTKGGIFPSEDVDDPAFIVGQSLSKIGVDKKEEFAKSRILQTATITEIEIEQSNQITIDGLSGYEVVARGKDTKSGQVMLIYQIILFEDQSYYILQGIVSGKQRETHLPTFKEMAGSFKRKR